MNPSILSQQTNTASIFNKKRFNKKKAIKLTEDFDFQNEGKTNMDLDIEQILNESKLTNQNGMVKT